MKNFFFLLFLIFFSNINSFADESHMIDLSKADWEYRLGDSPFEKNIPLWTKNDTSSNEWEKISFPSNPSNRDGKTNIWYRVKLPDVLIPNPHFYVYSIDIIAEVYLKSEKIYNFGEFDEKGVGEYKGWPWHMFPLPSSSPGEYLYFRIYSNYHDIGLFGEINIASKGYLFEKFLGHDIPKIMVSSVSIFVSVIFLLSFLLKFKRVELFILGSLFFTQGLNILLSVKVLQLYFFFPLLSQFILAISFFFFPVGMAMYLDKTIKYKLPFNIVRRIGEIHLLYILGSCLGLYFGLFEIPSTYFYFDILYYFITLPILTICMIYFFFKGDNRIKLITSSFLIISLYWVYSYLIAYQILPWVEYPSDIAVFLCLLLLSYSIVKNINYTIELENEKGKLSILSSTDYLTKLYNRREIDVLLKNKENLFKRYQDDFSLILLDIDDFKIINDKHGHLVGDDFLIEFGSILTKFTRETDFVGRWGGEEFLVICSKTNKEDALILAENLRNTIDKYQFDLIGHKTASLGVSTYKENDTITELLSRADDAMYVAKTNGKNRIRFR